MITRHTAEVVRITPILALEWLTSMVYERQRDMNIRRVKDLETVMKAGHFTGNTIQQAFLGDRWYIYNGQHTLMAMVNTNTTLDMTVERKWCETEEDLNHLYATTDKPKVRTAGDSIRAYGMEEKLGGLPAMTIQHLQSALRFINNGFIIDRVPIDSLNMSVQMLDWQGALDRYLAAVQETDLTRKKRAYRRDIMGIGLVTYQSHNAAINPDKFWAELAADDGLRATDPRRHLHRWITSSAPAAGREAEYGARLAARAWNYFWRNPNQEVKILKVVNPVEPVELYGVDYTIRPNAN